MPAPAWTVQGVGHVSAELVGAGGECQGTEDHCQEGSEPTDSRLLPLKGHALAGRGADKTRPQQKARKPSPSWPLEAAGEGWS